MADVVFDHVSIRYPGADRPTVADMSLTIPDGEFLVLVGPSGCGKSTTLRALAGLEATTGGTLSIGGRDVTGTEPKDRDIAMVFQDYALYPHMSVRENMGFALTIAKTPKKEIAERVERAAAMLDLTDYLDRRPKDLSGGQRQRVAMGRAIVREPQVFLMDEPLSNLDAKLRVQTRAQIIRLQEELGVTTVYVTHDQVEAMTMGDRVAVLRDGELQQVAPPRELYAEPANAFVAGFIGSPAMNLLPSADGTVAGLSLPDVPGEVRECVGGGAGGAGGSGGAGVIVGVRPEDLRVVDSPDRGLRATVTLVEELGADAYVHATTDVGELIVRESGHALPRRGDTVGVEVRDDATLHWFAADGDGRRLATVR
ncbi:ABC transporter ATP-binding protein [Corynebacterium bovis]|uniref:Trehalose import ATP-binding protein SugC n=1 Tax=Corynebacterium bovis TaxID=36808 RepID=A0A3R8PC49_9CORY|nr:sn-glycerol-3-phosphate ABC transporter ATP-binding protein UgpC [Corynebacterium bovis]MDN8578783.1 sn-glycerol-3-phosphate ABC transporter ATP-binding protein UgpC [Corynebacterium bovis]RRO86866.1 sugar ABC transporter ATP-binding protein [Corynebacterium bovis]RRO89336.1 sugar ABC transporter ATP-binding protein [Corynebacterium bovis]